MNTQVQQEIQTLIAAKVHEICSTFSAGWESAILRYEATWRVTHVHLKVVVPGGTENGLDVSELLGQLRELRDVMATPAHGTWMSLQMIVDLAGKFQFSFNYDERPDWYVEPSDEAYIEDLERYPRPFAEIPDWHPAKALDSGTGR